MSAYCLSQLLNYKTLYIEASIQDAPLSRTKQNNDLPM